jgi:hypothetical protein
MIGLGFATFDPVWFGLGFFLSFLICGVSALRSRKNRESICLEYDPEGLLFDMPVARVVYKWSTIGKVKKVGPRLFVMISGARALLIPDRATTPANMEKLQTTIADHRPA